jgi:hypothetical protein
MLEETEAQADASRIIRVATLNDGEKGIIVFMVQLQSALNEL